MPLERTSDVFRWVLLIPLSVFVGLVCSYAIHFGINLLPPVISSYSNAIAQFAFGATIVYFAGNYNSSHRLLASIAMTLFIMVVAVYLFFFATPQFASLVRISVGGIIACVSLILYWTLWKKNSVFYERDASF